MIRLLIIERKGVVVEVFGCENYANPHVSLTLHDNILFLHSSNLDIRKRIQKNKRPLNEK